jgi:hypothetical protein
VLSVFWHWLLKRIVKATYKRNDCGFRGAFNDTIFRPFQIFMFLCCYHWHPPEFYTTYRVL